MMVNQLDKNHGSFCLSLRGSGRLRQEQRSPRRLYRRLARLAVPARLTHEPGVTGLGKRITRLLKRSGRRRYRRWRSCSSQRFPGPARPDVIRPALADGKIVICDRSADSTPAYQGYGRGLALEVIKPINEQATGGLKPDLTILLDMAGEAGLARKDGEKLDRFHAEPAAFHRRVREGYLKMAAAEPKRWLVIDAAQDKETIAVIIWRRVSKLLPR
jgi:dTMP kinase